MTDKQINLAIGAITHAELVMDFSDVVLDALNSVIAFLATMDEQPKRKKGKWIKIPEFLGDDVSGFMDNHYSCSECKKEAEINPWGFYILSDFCPNCGADMRGKKNE